MKPSLSLPEIYWNFAAPEAQAQIRAAIQEWESKTCIRFQEENIATTVTQNHLIFTSDSG